MQLRYHAWANRQRNQERFSLVEHVVYASGSLLLVVLTFGSLVWSLVRPSAWSVSLFLLTVVVGCWLVARGNRYAWNLPLSEPLK